MREHGARLDGGGAHCALRTEVPGAGAARVTVGVEGELVELSTE